MFYKSLDIDVENIKSTTINGVKVGIVRGFASTDDVDKTDDIVLAGAFKEKLDELIAIGKKSMPMFLNHNRHDTIGGFPLELMRHDDNGLFVEGHINLDVEVGKETFALAKQNIFSFSVGFNIVKKKSIHEDDDDDDRIRVIQQGELMEISIVPIPANLNAIITEVKGATTFKNLPLASFDRTWDADAANGRIRTRTDSVESPSRAYRNAFFWFDSAASDKFGSYKLPFVDVIDGELKAVPRGIFAAAAALQGARGGVNIPASDRPGVISHVNRYYDKMGRESPLSKSFKIEMEGLETINDFDVYLKEKGFSSRESTNFIHYLKKKLKEDNKESISELTAKALKDLENKIDLLIKKY